jgi:DNA end-binding protein Ku
MAARSIGSLTISFGLVAIPVKLYTATQSANAISFNLLHKGCGSRLKQQYICAKDGSIVERDDMVKGYEFAKDQYVTFTPEEIKALEEAGTHAVEISEFVPVESIDPVYFDKTYYLAPDKGAGRPYGLLTEALKQAERAAVGRWAARGKAYIVVLRPIGDVLTMQQLHFAADVRSSTEIDVPKADVKPAELKLAQQLIEQQTSEKFDPTAYKDELRARIEASIQKKVEGAEISVSDIAPAGESKVIDLMEALRASLEKTETARTSASQLGPRKAPKRVEQPAAAAKAEQPAKPARKATKR